MAVLLATSEPRRNLVSRALLTLIVAYALTLGATYNGVLLDRLQIVSLILLTVGAAGWWWFVRRGSSQPATPLDAALIVWAAAYGVAALASESEGRAAIGTWYAGFYAGVWFILSDLRRRGLPGRWLTDAALLTSIPLIILALAQVADWFPAWITTRQNGIAVALVPPRPPSTLGNSNAFGAVIAMVLPLGLVRMRWSARRLDRALWAVWFALALLTLFLTSSRGAWLGAVCALGVMGFFALRTADFSQRWQHSRRFWWEVGGVILLALIVVATVLVLSLDVFDTPRRGTSERQELYRIALKTFGDHPLTGTGPFTFGRAMLQNRSVPPDQPHAHAHNLLLNTAAELGLPGIAALGVTVVLIIRRWWQVRHDTSDPAQRAHVAACGASLVAVGAHGLVDIPIMIPAVMLLLLSILAAGIVRPDRVGLENGSSLRRAQKMISRHLPGVLWVAVLVSGWWSAAVIADYIDGEQLIFDGDYSRAADALRRAAEAQPFIPLYDAEYAYSCGLAALAGDGACLPDGIAAYRRALDQEPAHAVWWANLAALYWQNGQPDDAIRAMRRAADYAPEAAEMWLNLGIYYEQQSMADLAAGAYRRVLEVRPVQGHARFWTETALRRAVLADNPVEETPYMRAERLWEQGRRDEAAAVFDTEITRDPTQPQPYFDWARLYIASGEMARARNYIDAGRLLVHTPLNQAWLHVLEAEDARASDDWDGWRINVERAAQLVLPDQTGTPLFLYGRDVANLHFLRLKVRGTLLPQLVTLGHDPILVAWLEDAYSEVPPD